jgi:hypothetical protein
LIATALPVVGTMIKQENCQDIGDRGGLFIQLPNDPGYGSFDWYAKSSSVDTGDQVYENFWDVASSISGIHWWGLSCDYNSSNCDPQGMTFNITFYEDNDSMPGDMICSYVDVEPSITATGILYAEGYNYLELYFFEYDLEPCCELSDGWVSVFQTGSDNGCIFCLMQSLDGDGAAYYTREGNWTSLYDVSLVLTDGEETDLEIVDVKGGLGVKLEIRNNGAETVDNYPVKFLVIGGLLKIIQIDAGETISDLGPGETITIDTGLFFGFGPITIFVVGDGIAAYKDGFQLFIFTVVQ